MLEELCDRAVRLLAFVAGAALLAMLALTVLNIALRAFATPFYGTFEVVGLLAAVVSGLALGVAQRERAHVAIDLVMSRAPTRLQLVVGAAVTLASVALFAMLAQQMWLYGMNFKEVGARSETLRLEFWPVPLVVAVGAAGLVLALIADLSQILRQLRAGEPQNLW